MGRRVLVIEDEANILAAISFILARDGWEVHTHGDGADAIEVIRAVAPDLVILDMMLPGCSGLDILRALRATPGTADLPVLMLTARVRSADRELAVSVGASRVMSKPFSNTEVLASVRALVAS